MKRHLIPAALTLLAVSAGSALANPFDAIYSWPNPFIGVYGHKGNDTGGIIPWSPENEKAAYEMADANCRWHNKYPVASSIHRAPGDYIAYRCVWDPPRARRGSVRVKVDR